MKLVLFTVEEANGLLEELGPRLQRLVDAKREYDRVQGRVDVLQVATSGASGENPDVRELEALRKRHADLAEVISRGVQTIHRWGCLVKDLDRGLVDFYALTGDRLVFLCWQLGESEISHWHSIEGGFSARQPLDRSELE
jgi:hypothetical protein